MSLRDAAQAALDAWNNDKGLYFAMVELRNALEALAEPQGEPDTAGLLHDRCHVDTGATRAAKSMKLHEPVARVTGYYGGRCVIEPLDGKSVFPTGMAVYTRGMRELSDEEIIRLWERPGTGLVERIRAIIAAAREKA